jgi:hypothetical protein
MTAVKRRLLSNAKEFIRNGMYMKIEILEKILKKEEMTT